MINELTIDILVYLRNASKYDAEAKEIAIKLIDLFILTPKET